MRALAWFEQFASDLRYGLRNLLKSPGLTAAAAGSLALGIGAATAMYSVIHAVIIDPFPYRDVDTLMSIRVRDPSRPGSRLYYSVDQYLEFASRTTIFEGVTASTISDVVWTGGGEPRRLRGNHVSMNTFDVLGVPPLLGRVLTANDAAPGAEPVAILGYKFWQGQLGGDPSAVGRQFRLNGTMRTVIGVMPPRFMWRGADVYVPVIFRKGELVEGVRDVHVLGRLKPGVSAARAEADLRPIVDDLRRDNPADIPGNYRVSLLSFKETFPSGIRGQLWVLFAAVGLLLLIACVNVSNLLLSKAATRAREIAVRASLGATRGRVLRQLLAESLLLAVIGGTLGIFLAWGGLKGIIAMVPRNTIPDEAQIAINVPVLLFTTLVCCVAALLFGIAPALHLSGQDPIRPLRRTGRGTAGSTAQSLLRNALVVGEVALSLMLLVGATLMVRTLARVTSLELSMQPERLLTMRIPISEQRLPEVERRNAFRRELLERVGAMPGIVSAGINTWMHPLGNWGLAVEVAGSDQRDTRTVVFHQVSQGYLTVMGIPLQRGRPFSEQDMVTRARFAIVNEAFASRYFAGGDAIGRMVRIPRLRQAPFRLEDDSFQIIGVVANVMNRIYAGEKAPELYIPHTISGVADYLLVLAEGDPLALAANLRAHVYALDRDQPVMEVKALDRVLAEWVYSGPRFNLLLFSIFAILGLVLAIFGVAGVISHGVSQRTQEIGIRVALGAGLREVVGMVVGRGALLVGIGILVGLAASLATVRLVAHYFPNLSAFDPLAFAAVALTLFLAGLAACIWPARRAARVDPVTALRCE